MDSFSGNISIELTEVPGPHSQEIKRIERYEDLIAARTIRVAAMRSPFVFQSMNWVGRLYTIEASGIPVNIPGGGDRKTGNMGPVMKESVDIAKTFCQNFIQEVNPGNDFF